MHLKIFLILLSFTFNQTQLSAQNKGLIFSVGAANANNAGQFDSNSKSPQFSLHYRKFRENMHFHQISINNFWTNNFSVSNFDVKEWQIGLQYAYGARVWSFNEKSIFYAGGTAGLEYLNNQATPMTAQDFERVEYNYSFLTGGFAKAQFFIFNQFILDLTFPVGLLRLGVDEVERKDPGLPERLRKQGGFNLDLNFNLGIELGLGWRF